MLNQLNLFELGHTKPFDTIQVPEGYTPKPGDTIQLQYIDYVNDNETNKINRTYHAPNGNTYPLPSLGYTQQYTPDEDALYKEIAHASELSTYFNLGVHIRNQKKHRDCLSDIDVTPCSGIVLSIRYKGSNTWDVLIKPDTYVH